MSENIIIIFVIGDAHEFTEELAQKFKEHSRPHLKYNLIHGDWNDFYDLSEKFKIGLLIVDFFQLLSSENIKNDIFQLIRKIVRIKKTEELRLLPIIGLFDNKETIEKYQCLQQAGLSYFHIIGDDFKLFFSNICVLGFEDESEVYKLAHATKLKIKMNLTHNIYMSELNGTRLTFESDISLSENFNVKIMDFFDNNEIDFELVDMNGDTEILTSLYSCVGEITINDGWEDGDNGKKYLCSEDVETWQENLKADNAIETENIIKFFFYTKNLKWPLKIIDDIDLTTLKTTSFFKFSPVNFDNSEEPNVIFYEIISESDYENFDELMSFLTDGGFSIYIIVKNHNSTAQALRKMYGYDYIMTTRGEFSKIEFLKLLNLLRSKSLASEGRSLVRLEFNRFVVQYRIPAEITSLTENEITFKTEVEIPLFSILQLKNENFNVLITPMPSYYNISPNLEGFHYMGVINGITEKDRQNLRKIVRLLISRPPAEREGGDLTFKFFEKIKIEESIQEIDMSGKKEKDMLENNLSDNLSELSSAKITGYSKTKTKDKKSKL